MTIRSRPGMYGRRLEGNAGATVYAVGGDKLFMFRNGAWTDTTIPGANLTAVGVANHAPDDVFFTGTFGFGYAFRGLGHFDGSEITQVRLPDGHETSTVKDVYVEAGQILVLVEDTQGTDVIFALARTTSW